MEIFLSLQDLQTGGMPDTDSSGASSRLSRTHLVLLPLSLPPALHLHPGQDRRGSSKKIPEFFSCLHSTRSRVTESNVKVYSISWGVLIAVVLASTGNFQSNPATGMVKAAFPSVLTGSYRVHLHIIIVGTAPHDGSSRPALLDGELRWRIHAGPTGTALQRNSDFITTI